jgi:hypothetical protein
VLDANADEAADDGVATLGLIAGAGEAMDATGAGGGELGALARPPITLLELPNVLLEFPAALSVVKFEGFASTAPPVGTGTGAGGEASSFQPGGASTSTMLPHFGQDRICPTASGFTTRKLRRHVVHWILNACTRETSSHIRSPIELQTTLPRKRNTIDESFLLRRYGQLRRKFVAAFGGGGAGGD